MNKVNLFNLVMGILLVLSSVVYFLYVLKRAKKDKNYDSMSYSFDVNVVTGIFAFFAVGLVLIYRELKYLF